MDKFVEKAEKCITAFIEKVKNDGIVCASIAGWRIIMWQISRTMGGISGNILYILFGGKVAIKIKIVFFMIRAKLMHPFKDRTCLWLGQKLEKIVYKEIVWISPEEVKYVIKDGIVPFLQSGDWDLRKRPFQFHPTIIDLYVNKKSYQETDQYLRMNEACSQGKSAYWCENEADIDMYFDKLMKAAEEINQGNYRVMSKEDHLNSQNSNDKYPNEILVSIDRDGNYLHEKGGSHRLSMAKICDIEKIPVVVIRKHYNYIKSHEKSLKLL